MFWAIVITAVVVFVLTGLLVRKTKFGKLFGEVGDVAQKIAQDVAKAGTTVAADASKLGK